MIFILSIFWGLSSPLRASTSLPEVYKTEPKKTQVYIHEGIIEGGESEVNASFVTNIRRSKNADFERVVLDFDSKKIPAFHISVEPKMKRILFTISGNTKPTFNGAQILKQFKKSGIIDSIELFPKIDEKNWTFNIKLKRDVPVEVFTLSQPERIVMDLKTIRLTEVIKAPIKDSEEN